MKLILILSAVAGLAGCARTAHNGCASTLTPVAAVDALDELTATHIVNTLAGHGIPAYVDGSVGLSVSVAAQHGDRALGILALDSVEFRYPIRVSGVPASWGVDSYDWRLLPVEGNVEQLVAGHTLDEWWGLRAALQPSVSGLRVLVPGTVLTAAARAERTWRRLDGQVDTAVMFALSWEGEDWVAGPDLFAVWREGQHVRVQFMGAAPAGLPGTARP